MARQSAQDRAERLAEGRCPIHGVDMPQIAVLEGGTMERCLVECPRGDCEIQGTSLQPSGPVELLPKFINLIGGGI